MKPRLDSILRNSWRSSRAACKASDVGSIAGKGNKRNFFKRNLNAVLGAVESSTSFIGHLLLADGLNRR